MYRYKVSRHDQSPDTVLVDAWSPVQAKIEARNRWVSAEKPAPLHSGPRSQRLGSTKSPSKRSVKRRRVPTAKGPGAVLIAAADGNETSWNYFRNAGTCGHVHTSKYRTRVRDKVVFLKGGSLLYIRRNIRSAGVNLMVVLPNDAEYAATADLICEKRFTKYVSVSLRRYAANWIREYRAQACHETAILNEPVSGEESDAIDMSDLLGKPELSAEEAFLVGADIAQSLTPLPLFLAYLSLTETQRLVIVGLTIHGMRQDELARLLHVSQQAISKAKAHALKRLRSAV